MGKLLRIFALGGNELSPTDRVDPKSGELIVPDVPRQWRRAARTCRLIADIVQKHPDNHYILTHGNGPQVGNILFRAEYAREVLHTISLDVCGANSQGAIGYMLAQLSNSLKLRGINKIAAETVTQVIVDENDPAFLNYTKFIGPILCKEEIKEKQEAGIEVKCYKKNDLGEKMWRRVVPSPKPKEIVEIDLIESNLLAGMIPIAVGGGGIPVKLVSPRIEKGEEIYECNHGVILNRPYVEGQKAAKIVSGIEAVIDKDLATALLGVQLIKRAKKRGEDLEGELTIFTDVENVKLNFQTPDEVDLTKLTLAELKGHYEKGEFPPGSMGPKVEAIIKFLEGGGKKAYITKVRLFQETLEGKAGTTIVP
ncbi:MAG: carbamate kinase [Bacteriovoracaceae bacterium]|nr:carbamate kinase [Bacteriovoracaceae bacterium]